MTAQPLAGPLRRVPVQGRSVARVNRMLDACAQLVDEVGYDGLTTTLLAERAGVAIGSVYQFFPDKRAIVQALTLRNLEAYLQRLGSRLSQEQSTHWWGAVDAAIDEYIAMYRTTPGLPHAALRRRGRRPPAGRRARQQRGDRRADRRAAERAVRAAPANAPSSRWASPSRRPTR